MAQIFSRSANVHSRVVLVGFVLLVCGAGWATSAIFWSPYTTYVDVPLAQPVPFSHKHHVGDDGIDCRYCHTSVEQSGFAGIPSTQICMTCHSQLWTEAPVLAPVRNSLTTNRPLQWNRVNDLPDFAYFNHSIHISKGVGCSTCHGELDKMPLTWRTQTLYMKWCLDCHRAPQNYVRPRSQIYNLHWQAPPDQEEQGRLLVRQNQIDTSGRLTNCSTCHR
ncbi:MAG: cytochrome c3 family protein [Chthoniobacterales bacterium]|nr:cytochrome c3 family protein [Chthoniobacterales bacterium]